MTAGLTDHDWELLSTYLDSSLSPAETRDVEDRLFSDQNFETALVSLRQTRAILRSVPLVKRRRNFYLTPDMAGQRKWTWLIPVFNLSSAATGLLAVILLVLNLLPSGMRAAPAQQEMMSAPVVQVTSVPANAMADAMSPAPVITQSESATAVQPEMMKEAAQQAEPEITPRLSLAEPSPATEGIAAESAPPAAAPLMAKGEEPAVGSAAATPEAVTAQKAVAEDQVLATPSPAPAFSIDNSQETIATPAVAAEPSMGIVENIPLDDVPAPEGEPQVMEYAPVEPHSEGYGREFSSFFPAAMLLLVSILLVVTGYVLRKRFR